MTVTLITLLKRREGMSREEFRDYYETHHRRIGEQVLEGYATRYVRRYLTPVDGTDQDFDYDVVMEIEFPDQATREACFSAMSDEATLAMIYADEEQLFDRSRNRVYEVSESASEF